MSDRRLRYWLPLCLWIAAILFVSSIPGSTISRVGVEFEDKLAHFLEYGILGFLAGRWERFQYGHRRLRASLTAFALGLAVATLDELYQGLIPGRMQSVGDWTADLAGIGVGTIISVFLYSARGTSRTVEERAEP